MSEKEKADELIERFTKEFSTTIYGKRVALIVVNEIIDSNDEFGDDDFSLKRWRFYKNVKSEIEKL